MTPWVVATVGRSRVLGARVRTLRYTRPRVEMPECSGSGVLRSAFQHVAVDATPWWMLTILRRGYQTPCSSLGSSTCWHAGSSSAQSSGRSL
jgi:hypothetical protein